MGSVRCEGSARPASSQARLETGFRSSSPFISIFAATSLLFLMYGRLGRCEVPKVVLNPARPRLGIVVEDKIAFVVLRVRGEDKSSQLSAAREHTTTGTYLQDALDRLQVILLRLLDQARSLIISILSLVCSLLSKPLGPVSLPIHLLLQPTPMLQDRALLQQLVELPPRLIVPLPRPGLVEPFKTVKVLPDESDDVRRGGDEGQDGRKGSREEGRVGGEEGLDGRKTFVVEGLEVRVEETALIVGIERRGGETRVAGEERNGVVPARLRQGREG